MHVDLTLIIASCMGFFALGCGDNAAGGGLCSDDPCTGADCAPVLLYGHDPASAGALSWGGFIHNLVPVTLGNLVGGGGLVGLVYWLVYQRSPPSASPAQPDS